MSCTVPMALNSVLFSSTTAAEPKSMTFIVVNKLSVNIKFSGLMSLWTMLKLTWM